MTEKINYIIELNQEKSVFNRNYKNERIINHGFDDYRKFNHSDTC